MKSLLEFGYVARPHGLAGECAVRVYDASTPVFAKAKKWVALTRQGHEVELRVRALREGPKGDVLAFFVGVTNQAQAKALVGSKLHVHRKDLGRLKEGEFFQGDLVGLKAFDPSGKALGEVVEVWSSGPVPNLVIQGEGEELMIPFADEFVVQVNAGEGTIVVRPLDFGE